MFTFLDEIFIKEFFKIFFIILIILSPVLFFADFVLLGSFCIKEAFLKLIYRYSQFLLTILLISSYFTTLNFMYKDFKILLISLGQNYLVAIKSIFIINIIISFLYYFLIIPSNDYFFNQNKIPFNWNIVRTVDNYTCYIHKLDKGYELFLYNELTKHVVFLTKEKIEENYEIQDFCVIWLEPKKMSFTKLNECRAYFKRKGLDYSHITKQIYIYKFKFILFFLIILLGMALAIKNNMLLFFLILLITNWLDIVSFYLRVKYCIIVLCLNCMICLFVSIYLLI